MIYCKVLKNDTLKEPNIGMVYISENLPEEVYCYFASRGHTVRRVSAGDALGAVAAHPDIYMCAAGDFFVCAEKGEAAGDYPHNASFCALVLDRYFVHNLKITSPRLQSKAKAAGLIPVHVKQGYTKCSCAVVDGKSVITSDEGISRALLSLGDVDVLKITPGHILLPGHEYGFIGGASGIVDGELVFCGDISAHPDFERIRQFAGERGVNIKWFPFPLTDAGGIIERRQ